MTPSTLYAAEWKFLDKLETLMFENLRCPPGVDRDRAIQDLIEDLITFGPMAHPVLSDRAKRCVQEARQHLGKGGAA